MATRFLKELDRLEKEWTNIEDPQQSSTVSRTLLDESAARMGRSMFLALNDGKMPLLDAARRAYSETEDSKFAVAAEAGGRGNKIASPDDILLRYAFELSRRSTIWGLKPPSDTTKPQDLTDYTLVMRDTGIVARKTNGKQMTNLMVSRSDLDAFIGRVKKWPDEPL